MTAPIPGLPATYTIVVHNRGPSAVAGATVTDVFPPALLGASWTCTADPGSMCPASGTGNLAATIDLERGDQATFTVSGTLASGATGVLTNTATVAVPAGVTDPDATNNTSTSTVTLTPTRGHAGHEDRADAGDARHEHHLHGHGRRTPGRRTRPASC